MRSGNGRHRRPRQAPALFVTAGVAGAGIAIPLLGATGAQAADAGIWDRVADCESGGEWSAKNSDGYYGGLQLDLDTWKYYGGTMYAERPDLASRSQQIAVGEKILEAEGPRAFPSCGSALKVEGLPDLDPDKSKDRDPEPGPSETPSETPSDESSKSGDPDDSSKPDKTDKPGKPGKDSSNAKPTPDDDADKKPSDKESDKPGGDTSKSQRPSKPSDDDSSDSDSSHGGASDEEASAPGSSGWSTLGPGGPDRLKSLPEESDKPGKYDKSGKGKHRGQPADEKQSGDDRASREEDRDQPGKGGGKHRVTVRAGDSLAEIAKEQDVAGGWEELYEQNREAIGDDPDLLRPGQHLKL